MVGCHTHSAAPAGSVSGCQQTPRLSLPHYCCDCIFLLVRYAIYALLCGVVYVVGFPLGVFVLLFRRRHKLFGSDADPFVATTRTKYGFLYEVSSGLTGRTLAVASRS